ncbi:uncharacterized protein [Asterias amurensis]|uniref:uncharacterized protein n=1 Tax=Asterias amurensis TaxID=7602 RepID=UPI003AB49C2A
MDYEKLGCLHDIFRRQAKSSPDNVAIVTDDGKTLTYKELDNVTDVLATHLSGKGVVGDSMVGIYLEKCIEYPVAYIAILKAGGAYLPLDISYPQALLEDILEDAKPVSVISFKELQPRLHGARDVTILDGDWYERLKADNATRGLEVSMCAKVNLDSLAFVAYSSGTTGKPKGIMCLHRAAVFSYHWRHVNYPFQDGDRIACHVFFVWEMMRPLLKGYPMYIIPDHVIYDPALLLSFLERHSITRMLFTPSLLDTVFETEDLDIAKALKAFRLIILCGEVVTVSLMDRIAKTLPEVTVMNLYSVSETHDVAVANLNQEMKKIKESGTKGKTQKFCPVGKLLPGMHVIILNDDMEVQPVGSPGEIYVGGAGLARGYLNRPEMNAKRFIPRPANVPEYVGTRLYRSGDWGYLLSDGNLEICGRCDTMVKIRGYSIEIQAVEAALLALPLVNACAVLVKGAEGDDKYLVAYIVPAEQALTKKDIRAALKTRIPGFMVPAHMVFLASMPLLPASGKLDKKALPEYDPSSDNTGPLNGDQGKPSTETEVKIAGMWREMLRLEYVDAQESFFDLGGHSLLAARLLTQIKEGFGVEMTVRELFIHSTVTQMSSLIDSKARGNETDKSSQLVLDLHQEVEQHDQGIVSIDMQLRAFWRSITYGDRWRAGRVLLTGATGFLGVYILREILSSTQNHVYCLVKEAPDQSGKERLLQTMKQYGMVDSTGGGPDETTQECDLLGEFNKRVTAITGDVSLIKLGMMEEDYTYLSFEVDSVIHAAAYVNLVYPYEALRGANVIGTQNVVLFACTNKIKPLHYVSTNSVFPVDVKQCSENADMSTHSDQLSDGYSQSKWVSEQLVQRAKSRGLPVVIYRLGNLSGDSKTSSWNPSDSNLLTLQGCFRTLSAPDVNWMVEMTPVDFSSQIIVKVSQNLMLGVGKVFHLVHPQPLHCRTLFQWARDLGYPFRMMPFYEWSNELRELQRGTDEGDSLLASKLENIVRNESFFLEHSSFSQDNLKTLLQNINLSYPPLNKHLISGYLLQLLEKKILKPPKIAASLCQDKPLQGKVAIITGGSNGIGLGIAKCLVQAGASVALAARRQDKLDEAKGTIEAIGGRVITVKTDVCVRQQVKDLVAKTEAELGPVDILVNNAGVMYYTSMISLLEDEWERTVDVNCKGVLNGIGAVLKGMVARGKGHIVNTTSDAGRAAFPGIAVYSGSKFFVEGMTSALRKEIIGTGVRVTNVQPGDVTSHIGVVDVDPEATKKYKNPEAEKYLSPDDIGRAVVYAVTQPIGVSVNEILIQPTDYPI